MEEYSNSIPDLPTDFLIQVFCRLPVKTLVRLSCVCKFWKDLIRSDRIFIRCHLKESLKKTNRSSSNVLMYSDWPFKNATGTQELSARRFINADENCLGKSFYLGSFLYLVECVNGVFCFYHYRNFNLYLWNPALHQFRMLPHNKGDYYFYVVAFYYEPTNDDYIVVKILWTSVHIYKLSSNSWTETKFPHRHYSMDIKHRVAVVHNGALFWLSYSSSLEALFLNVYDLSRKSFQGTLLSNHVPLKTDEATLGLIKGCISLLGRSTNGHKYEMWMMKEYGVENSWTKQFEIPPTYIIPQRYMPGTSTSGIFLVIQKFGVKQEDYVVLYNPETKETKFAQDESILLYQAYTEYFFTDYYVESLVSVFPPVKRAIDESTSVRRTGGRLIAKQEDYAVLHYQETELKAKQEDYAVLYYQDAEETEVEQDETKLSNTNTEYFSTNDDKKNLISVFPHVERTVDETTLVRRTTRRFIAKQEDYDVLYSQETEENELETGFGCLRFLKRLFGRLFV